MIDTQRETIQAPKFSEDDVKVLKTYFELNKNYHEKINQELTPKLINHKLWGPLMASMTPEQMKAQNERSLELQRAAIYDNKWDEYYTELITQGKVYARMNINYDDWYEIVRMYKVHILPHIKKDFANSIEDGITFLDGLSKFTDYAMYVIAEAYFQEKNEIIRKTYDLLKNSELYHLMVTEIEDYAILLLDPNGNVMNWNKGAEKIKGYEAHEIIGKNINVFYSKEDRESNLAGKLIEEALSTGRASDEGWRVKKDGTRFWASVFMTVIREDDKVVGFSKVTRDLTERKEAEEQLVFANKELEAFSYSVSHDLRAPLRAINGYAKILEEDYFERFDSESIKILHSIKGNSKKMGQLIDDLLAFSRLTRKSVSVADINMNDLIKSIQEELLDEETQSITDFNVAVLPTAKGDQALIKQVWINLISNAIKYSKTQPRIKISIGASHKGDLIEYHIKDNGVGFDMEYYDVLFGVFQRLHSQTEFEGTGIGLAIVQKIIRRHNGTVWAEAKVNEGANFYFTLPNSNS